MLKQVDTNLYVISGKGMFCRVNKAMPEKDFNNNTEYRFRTDLVIDDADYKPFITLLKTNKVKQEIKVEEETQQGMFQFRRVALMDGKEALNPPEVTDKAGNKHDPEVAIGNGSDLLVCFELVQTKKQGQYRVILNSVRVVNLIPYVPEPVAPPPPAKPNAFAAIKDEDLPF